jgi:ligand-binding sensor domain-containing protein/signal transduction histidine kinase
LINLNTFLETIASPPWRWKGFLFELAVVCCCASLAQAIDPHRMLSQYMRDHWGSEKGFTGGPVTDIAQTPDGYLWIGTERGLIRFDGFSFRTFPEATPTTFAIGPVRALTADAEGNLWILLQSTKILRYHDGKFELGREETEVGITSMVRGSDGKILFSSLALGPLTYRGGKFEELNQGGETSGAAGGAPAGADQLSSRLSWATGVTPHRYAEPNSAVLSMAETSDGKLWLGTRDKGLFYMSEGKVTSAGKELADKKINCLLVDANGILWIGTEKGLLRWNGKEVTSEGVPSELRSGEILSMIRDRDANAWIGTSHGLIRVNADGVSVDNGNLRSAAMVTALFEDREGNIWVGSPAGIDRVRDSAFITYSVGGLQSASGGPVFVDQEERAWFAPYDGGLHWLKGDKNGSLETDGLRRDVVYSISGGKSELWVGRQQGGLTHVRFAGGAVSAKTYTEKDGLAQDSVYAVHENRDGTVWAGTLSGGVSEFKEGHFTKYTSANGLSSNTVSSIAEGANGTMWFATPKGINALNDGQWRVFASKDGLPSDNVNCLWFDSAGVLWAGTAMGLAFVKGDRVLTPFQEPGSLHDPILGIAEDKNGWLWISTSNHVLRVKREGLLNGTLDDADVHEYGIEDGLNGLEGVKRYHSVFADGAGKIWFSMNRGLSVVDPARAIGGSAPALIHVDGVTADGNAVPLQDTIRLTGTHHRLIFNYDALSLSVPERVQYRYKLEGVDEQWSNPVNNREVTYNNLNSGTYRFRLMASNSEGMWNSAEAVVPFEIAPEYWQTWWFRTSAALAGGLLILLFYRLRIRKVAAQMNMRFEERLAERTRIAQELHDTLLQGFLSASMQLHVADDRLPEDSPAKPLVGRALQLMTRVIDEGRNTVRGLRSVDLRNQKLEESFSRLQQELAPTGHAEFRVIVEGAARPLRAVSRDDIYSIGREAIINAFRHAGAKEIVVEIDYTASHLRMLVRDNGCGIDPRVLRAGRDGHWGLSGMRERAERIDAKLRVLSRAAAGTEIELIVPSRMAYEPQNSDHSKAWFSKLYARKDKDKEEKIAAESGQRR